MMENQKSIITAFVASTIILISASCGPRKEFRTAEGATWNTTYNVIYESDRALDDSIRNIFRTVGHSVSTFEKGSLTDRLNNAPEVKTDEHLRKVYEMSEKVNRLTDGTFDPTLEPLITAWGFGADRTPSSDTLRTDSLLQFVGIEKTRLENGIIKKENPLIRFNFSGVAKGYGVDCIARMLERNGVKNYMVEVGGEIRCNGHSPRKGKWRLGIDSPNMDTNPGEELERVVELSGISMATSGNYRNYHKNGTKSFGHTIDRKTGRPVTTDVLSATVLTPDCAEADALATAFMAMGSAKGKEFAESRKIPVMLILSGHHVWESPEFKKLTAR